MQVLVNTKEQLNTVLELGDRYISRIYIENSFDMKFIPNDISSEIEVFIAGPYVLRDKDIELFKMQINSYDFSGILIRDMETLCFLDANSNAFNRYKFVIDNSIYILNNNSVEFLNSIENIKINELFNSYELNLSEIKQISCDKIRSNVIYGHIPMMVSANCTQKTLNGCAKSSGISTIKDRKGANFPVFRNCDYCYNIIYNSVVLSLHNYIKPLSLLGNLRIDFLNEDAKTCNKVILYFNSLMSNYSDPFYKEFTTGHIKRGIE